MVHQSVLRGTSGEGCGVKYASFKKSDPIRSALIRSAPRRWAWRFTRSVSQRRSSPDGLRRLYRLAHPSLCGPNWCAIDLKNKRKNVNLVFSWVKFFNLTSLPWASEPTSFPNMKSSKISGSAVLFFFFFTIYARVSDHTLPTVCGLVGDSCSGLRCLFPCLFCWAIIGHAVKRDTLRFFFIRGEANVTFSQCKRAWVFAVGEGGCGTTRSGRRPDFFLFFLCVRTSPSPFGRWSLPCSLIGRRAWMRKGEANSLEIGKPNRRTAAI